MSEADEADFREFVTARWSSLVGTAYLITTDRGEPLTTELVSYGSRADVLVLPSHSEGTPNVVLEFASRRWSKCPCTQVLILSAFFNTSVSVPTISAASFLTRS